MSTKKRKPLLPRSKNLSSVQRKLYHPNTTIRCIASTNTHSITNNGNITNTATTPFALLPTATPPQPEASAPEPVPIQSKEPSLMSKLQAPDKEATVRFTVDMSETLHRKLSMLAACDGAQESG
jgi:hypothetical protein